MKNRVATTIGAAACGALLFARPIPAQELDARAGVFGESHRNTRHLQTGVGTAFLFGGGVNILFDEETSDLTSDTAGVWEARAVLGTEIPVGAEIAYVGSAYNFSGVDANDDAYLLGSGLEGLARVNLWGGTFQPFVAGGLGWGNYSIVDAGVVPGEDTENVLTIPLAAGLAVRKKGLVLDIRNTYRIVPQDELAGADVEFDSYGFDVRVGFEI